MRSDGKRRRAVQDLAAQTAPSHWRTRAVVAGGEGVPMREIMAAAAIESRGSMVPSGGGAVRTTETDCDGRAAFGVRLAPDVDRGLRLANAPEGETDRVALTVHGQIQSAIHVEAGVITVFLPP